MSDSRVELDKLRRENEILLYDKECWQDLYELELAKDKNKDKTIARLEVVNTKLIEALADTQLELQAAMTTIYSLLERNDENSDEAQIADDNDDDPDDPDDDDYYQLDCQPDDAADNEHVQVQRVWIKPTKRASDDEDDESSSSSDSASEYECGIDAIATAEVKNEDGRMELAAYLAKVKKADKAKKKKQVNEVKKEET